MYSGPPPYNNPQPGQSPPWPPQQRQTPTWYPPNQGWGSPQQPPTQHPPYQQAPRQPVPPQYQQPYYPPPMLPPPPPPRKSRVWLIVLVVVGGLVLCGVFGNAVNSQSSTGSSTANNGATTQATDTPVPTTWTTIQTFTGNGSKKTGVFTVPSHWRVEWSCNPASFNGVDYNVIIGVYGSDGSYIDDAVNSTCSHTSTSGTGEEYQGGDIYLDITSEGDWTIEVQELQ